MKRLRWIYKFPNYAFPSNENPHFFFLLMLIWPFFFWCVSFSFRWLHFKQSVSNGHYRSRWIFWMTARLSGLIKWLTPERFESKRIRKLLINHWRGKTICNFWCVRLINKLKKKYFYFFGGFLRHGQYFTSTFVAWMRDAVNFTTKRTIDKQRMQ